MIYLDNAATTQVCPQAAQAALDAMTAHYGNPSSTHGPGRDARAALQNARRTMAESLGATPDEVFFTSGGSEGDNWALMGACRLMRHKGRHIVSGLTEHDAVRKTLDALETQGWEVTRLAPGPDGAVSPEAVAAALRPDTVLVSLMLVNNETGAITDIPAVARAIKTADCQALLHTDAIQAYMKLPLDVKPLGADIVTVSGHKIHAPKGVGAQYIRSGLRLSPLILGGGQENDRRSGTENLPGILALAAAVEAYQADADAPARMAALRQRVIDRLTPALPDMLVIGGGAPHILCLAFPGYRSEVLLNYLDGMGVCVSKGSACKRGARSHVLQAMALPARIIDGAIRISFGRFNTEADADALCDGLLRACATLRKAL